MSSPSDARQEIAQYLRWLADQPDGINHRALLFRAAWILTQGMGAIHIDRRQERHGDQTV